MGYPKKPLYLALLLVLLSVMTSCGTGIPEVTGHANDGWSSYAGNNANSNSTNTAVAANTILWSRPLGGQITSPPTTTREGAIAITASTTAGCNVFLFEVSTGRKNVCRRLGAGVQTSSVLFDQYSNLYLGEAGQFFSLAGTGAIRWRFGVLGIPLSAKFAGPNLVLMVSTKGQLLLFNANHGELAAPGIALQESLGGVTDGFGDCIAGGPACPVSAPPAVDQPNERFILNYWPTLAQQPQLRAFSYRKVHGTRQIQDIWTAEISGGAAGTPTLSHDGKTVYTFNRLGTLFALDAASGTLKWDYQTGGTGFATLSVSHSGTIIPAGIVGNPLVALEANGKVKWARDELHTASGAIQTATTGWVTIRGKNSLELLEFNPDDGTTLSTHPLPKTVGYTTGISVGAHGEIITTTQLGEIFVLGKTTN